MRYEFLFPAQLQAAKAANLPFILPLGTLEYHGAHCAYGCDGLIARGVAERLEQRMPLVILPTYWYGASSYAVGGPEKGTIDIGFHPLMDTLSDLFAALLEGGARNVVTLIHHQFEQENYMPATLAAASAAKTTLMAYLETHRGRGWWGDNRSKDYYGQLNAQDNPMNWIRVLPTMSKGVQDQSGYDHAGQYECALLRALYPEAVNLENLSEDSEWFAQSARLGTPELGRRMLDLCLDDLLARLRL